MGQSSQGQPGTVPGTNGTRWPFHCGIQQGNGRFVPGTGPGLSQGQVPFVLGTSPVCPREGSQLSQTPSRPKCLWLLAGVDKRVVFQMGGFGGCSPGTKTGTRVHSDVPLERQPERGSFPCSPGTKTGTRVHSPKPPFYCPPSDIGVFLSRFLCLQYFLGTLPHLPISNHKEQVPLKTTLTTPTPHSSQKYAPKTCHKMRVLWRKNPLK